MKIDKKSLCFFVRETISGEYYHIDSQLLQMKNAQGEPAPRESATTLSKVNGEFYSQEISLSVSCQGSKGQSDLYAFRVNVDANCIEGAKTLYLLTRGIKQENYSRTYAEYLLNVAEGIGVKTLAIVNGENFDKWGFDKYSYEFLSLNTGILRVSKMESDYLNSIQERVTVCS